MINNMLFRTLLKRYEAEEKLLKSMKMNMEN